LTGSFLILTIEIRIIEEKTSLYVAIITGGTSFANLMNIDPKEMASTPAVITDIIFSGEAFSDVIDPSVSYLDQKNS